MNTDMENLVDSVKIILKNLECSICLEILKNPMSTGCGHFFCRYCITEVLQSNYRTPCPLCKKSFTRRGIQEAHQRKSIISAVEKLADVCGKFAGVQFFYKENSQAQIGNENSSCVPPFKKQSTVVEKSHRSSSAKKRKSNENEDENEIPEDDSTAALTKNKTSESGTEALKGTHCVSSNDEIIASSSKRCRQLYDDSDSEDLPDLMDIIENRCTPKAANRHSLIPENDENKNMHPIVLVERITNSDSNKEQVIDSSLATVLLSETSLNSKVLGESKGSIENVGKTTSVPKKNDNNKCLNIKRKNMRKLHVQGSKFKTGKKTTALRNKTNELNLDNIEHSSCDASKGSEKIINDVNLIVHEENDSNRSECNKLIKNNEETETDYLFSSPVGNKDIKKDPTNLRKSKSKKSRSSMTEVKTGQQNSTSTDEEDRLIESIKKAENFQLSVSKNTIPSTVLINSSVDQNECYNLNEIKLPNLNNSQPHNDLENVGKLKQFDDIANSVVSVQSVDSPKTTKGVLPSRSPGWSKVKQVGKEFRVRKFSKLSVEKNSSNIQPPEITSIVLDSDKCSPLSVGSFENVKFKKLCCDGNIIKDMHIKELPANAKNEEDNERYLHVDKSYNHFVNEQQAKHPELPSGAEVSIVRMSHSEPSPESDPNFLNDVVGIKRSETEIINTNEDSLHNAERIMNTNESLKRTAICDLSNEHNRSQNDNGMIVLSSRGSCTGTNLISVVPVENRTLSDCLQNFQTPSNLNENNAAVKNAQLTLFNSRTSYENENMNIHIQEKMDIDYLNEGTKSGHSKTMLTTCDAIGKKIPIQNLPDEKNTNELYEIYNPSDVSVHLNLGNCTGKEMSIDVSDSKAFFVPNPKMIPETELSNGGRLLSKSSKVSKCAITSTETIINKDEDIYYTEHSQQTSQRLLKFCDNRPIQTSAFTESVANFDVPFFSATKFSRGMLNPNGAAANTKNWSHQIDRFNPIKFSTDQQSTEKTKVLKRTCLTLEEIQDSFTKSNMSEMTETICSLPFLSGEFRLHVCVSEETLNISVLKVIGTDSPNVIPPKFNTLMLSEKDIQTSNNYSPVHPPLAIFPSSNVGSDSSQPDQDHSDANSRKHEPFPYLSKYFSDSESTEQLISCEKEQCLNESEVLPIYEPLGTDRLANKKKTTNSVNLKVPDKIPEKLVEDVFHPNNISNHNITNPSSTFQLPSNELIIGEDLNDGKQNIAIANAFQLNDSFEDLPPTQPNGQSNSVGSFNAKSNSSDGIVHAEPVKVVLKTDTIDGEIEGTAENKSCEKHANHDTITRKDKLSNSREKSNDLVTRTLAEESVHFDDISADMEISTISNYQQMLDSEGFSSDPDMAYATELVAPLKNLAEKMKSTNSNKQKQTKDQVSPEGSAKAKRSLQDFEEIVSNMGKTSCTNDSLAQKSSRLSLKSKQKTKRFKRIKKYKSDDSDSSESSKNESFSVKSSSTKQKVEDSLLKSSDRKNDLPSESLQEQSTLSSFLSGDITNENTKEIAMEIEDLDMKILSVVEKLKQCGREDLLKKGVQAKLDDTKESPESQKTDKDCDISNDSEASEDIFSQSVPPTPPDAASSNNVSVFKSVHYSHD